MRIAPYVTHPKAPRVAWLDGDGLVWLEGGDTVAPELLPDGYRCWTSYDVAVNELLARSQGEALCWNNEPIRWRPSSAVGFQSRRAVYVLRLPFPPEPELCLRELQGWRDWLEACGASPTGTLGSSSWSLLKASLSAPLWTNVGELPPITFTLGGRQEAAPAGVYEGELTHVDMPAAYAAELGALAYGGRWHRVPGSFRFDMAATGGLMLFVRAKVRVPAGVLGPLPRRPRSKPKPPVLFEQATYPSGCRLQGTWTWDELVAARDAGCDVRPLEGWVHMPEGRRPRPFARWWGMVQVGRGMDGVAGMLAKATGNALWGQFCISSGSKSVNRWTAAGRLVRVQVPVRGQRPGSPDLAETVTGRVRARLYRMMLEAGDGLVSAHTDGGWVRAPFLFPGWREKDEARRIELLNPQMLAYTRPAGERLVVAAGVPSRFADRVFSRAWTAAGLEPAGKGG